MVNQAHAGEKSTITVVRAPALVDESAANYVGTGVDMKGYDRVRFMLQIGAMVNGSTLDAWAVEDDHSNMTNATAIYQGENNTLAQAAVVQITNAQNNSVHVIDVARPKKEYVSITLNAGTANVTLASILAERFRGAGVLPPGDRNTNDQYVAVSAE